jgi:hypothetical protein
MRCGCAALIAARIAATAGTAAGLPGEVIHVLGRGYQLAVAITGGVGGAIAIVPTIGTIAALATASAEALAALTRRFFIPRRRRDPVFPTEIPERRRALVLGVAMAKADAALRKVTGKSGNWAQTSPTRCR